MDARRALCSWILRVEERSPDLVPQAMEASARREIHIRHRDSAWRSFMSNLYLRTRSSAVSSPRKAPSGRFCISRRAAMTWPGHTGRPIRRTCISAHAPIVCATTKVHLLPDRRTSESARCGARRRSQSRRPGSHQCSAHLVGIRDRSPRVRARTASRLPNFVIRIGTVAAVRLRNRQGCPPSGQDRPGSLPGRLRSSDMPA